MNNEIMALRGRLAANEELIKTMTSGIDVDIDELRTMLDRYAPKSELNAARIRVVADRLVESLDNLETLQRQTNAIRRDLGL